MDRCFQRRMLLLLAFFATALSLLSLRLIYLQHIRKEYYAAFAKDSLHKTVTLHGRRGSITDRHGQLLACNEARFTFYADSIHLNDLEICAGGLKVAEGIAPRDLRRIYTQDEVREHYFSHVVQTLARPLGFHDWELARLLGQSGRSEIILRKEVTEEAAIRLEELMDEAAIKGIYGRRESRRFYPSPHRLVHVLGYTNRQDGGTEVGREGIEGAMEPFLRGEDGERTFEKDRLGREIPAYRGDVLPPKDGNDVQLTIDMHLQEIVESVLDERGSDPEEIYLPDLAAEKVSVILTNPMTGEILAMANRPDFDLNSRSGNTRNFAVADVYEPGSTFKIVSLGGAFDRGVVTPNTPIHCNYGHYQEAGVSLDDHHPYGELTVTQVMAKSSNIGAYKLARQLGKIGFHDYMKAYGFGEGTGLNLTAESSGVVHAPERWSAPSFSRMAMGYEVAVTPLQMVAALGVVANGGELLVPRIVRSVVDASGKPVLDTERTVVRRVISERAAAQVKQAMVAVTSEGGTGTKGCVEGYSVAAKTGTAQKYDPATGQYLSGRYVVSYMGFLPAEDPKLAAIVVVDDPKTDKVNLYGGTIAGPIFARIATRAMAAVDVTPEPRPAAFSGGATQLIPFAAPAAPVR